MGSHWSALTIAGLAAALAAQAATASVTVQGAAVRPAVLHSPVDRQMGLDCWAFALIGLIEGEALKAGKDVRLNPEYTDFYWLYEQIRQKLNAPDAGFVPDEGLETTYGLDLVERYGAVPVESVPFRNLTSADEDRFLANVAAFVKATMADPAKIALYGKTGADGVNDRLFDDFSAAVGAGFPRPNQRFTYRGNSYTPKTFVASYLKFDPRAYALSPDSNPGPAYPGFQEQQALLRKIRASLQAGFAAEVGFTLWGDPTDADPSGDIYDLSRKNGIYTTQLCKDLRCTVPAGGHVALVVNWMEDAGGNITALILKNSCGRIGGLDDMGIPAGDPSLQGYFIIEARYLFNSPAYPQFLIRR